jgi:long-subunit fatty acid transport protein
MKGIVAYSLLVVFVLVSGAAASDDYPVFDEEYLTARAISLTHYYPLSLDFNGGGARAKGMGNAFLGVADDISAITWNPAGLYRPDDQYSQPVVGLGYKSISSDATFRDRMYVDVPWYEATVSDALSNVDFMSVVLPLRIKGHMFVGSAAYSRLADEFDNSAMALDVMIPFTSSDALNGINRLFSYRNNVQYRSWVNAYNFGFGTRVYRNLSFGLSVNTYSGGAAQLINESISWDSLIVPGMMGSQRADVSVLNQVVDTTGYSGVYFTLGFKLNAERFTAGLVIKTPHVLKEMTDYRTDRKITANGYDLANSFVSVYNDNVLVELDQPLVLGLGLSYKVVDNWLLAADFEYRGYGGCKINVRDSLQLVPGGTNIEYFTELDPLWNNCVALRLGTEYMWTTGKTLFPTVPLRAGIGYIQVPGPDIVGGTLEIVNGQIDYVAVTETAATTRWALGTGVYWSQIHLDASFESYSVDQKNTVISQESSVANHAFSLTFTGFF